MKKLALVIIMANLLSILILSSCNELLNLSPKGQISQTAVWNDPNLIEAFLNGIYLGLGAGGLAQGTLAELTSDAQSIPVGLTKDIVTASINPAARGLYENSRGDIQQFRWSFIYKYIRKVNLFLENIDNSAINSQEDLDRMKGEAYFLRAYFYHNLLRMYGGVPIIKKAYDLNDTMRVPRNSFKETVEFVVQDCNKAAKLLPTVQEGAKKGRATKGAALALKSRILLYAASDFYNLNPSGLATTGYIHQQDRRQLWADAKNAAKAVIDLGIYSLYKANPSPGDSTAKNYYDLFRTYGTKEAILERYWPAGRGEDFLTSRDIGPNQYHGPNGFHQWGGNTPTQQMVDAYEMNDGSDFSWKDPKEAAHPYKNRDPRFYGTILYDGASWFNRPSDVVQYDHDNVIQTFKSLKLSNGTIVPGVDTRNSPIEPWNATYTGYYMRKFIDENQPPPYAQQSVWIFIRYAEVLLNYAEASIELGEDANARYFINKIRQRAGMPELATNITGQNLMNQYRQERRIELAFENQRYFDIRRWMIAPNVMDRDVEGIKITAKATDRAERNTYYDYKYEVITVQDRQWNDKLYFQPIPRSEMESNPKLVQNPGY